MKITIASRIVSYQRRPQIETRYFAVIERVGLFDYVRGRLYHWYDMRIPTKVPGHRSLRALARRFGAEERLSVDDPAPRWRDRFYVWDFNQDIRCWFLNEHKRETVLTIEITEEQYDEWGATNS